MATTKVIVRNTIDTAKVALKNDASLSESAKLVITSLMEVTVLLSNHLGLNSANSSKPPSTDPNRIRKSRSSGKKESQVLNPDTKGLALFLLRGLI